MSLNFNIINPINTWNTVAPLSLDSRGITEANLKLSTNEPHQLNITINTNLGENWNLLRENMFYGIKVTGARLDTGFVKAINPQADNTFGVINLGFFSPMYNLKYSQPLNSGRSLSRYSAQTLIAGLDPNFDWQFISSDERITIETGNKNNFELLQDIISQTKWSYFDAGMVSTIGGYKPQIIIGNSSDLALALSSDPRFAKVYARKADTDNPFDSSAVLITGVKKNYAGDVITHFQPLGNVGQGTATNSVLKLNSTGYDFIDPNYPIVAWPNSRTGETDYYIFDARAAAALNNQYRFATDIFDISSSTQNEDGTPIFNLQDAYEYMYKRGRRALLEKTLVNSYNYDYIMKEILLPGTVINNQYKEVIKGIDGTSYPVFDINEDTIYKGSSFDLLSMFN